MLIPLVASNHECFCGLSQSLIGALYLVLAFSTVITALSLSSNSATYWQYGLLFLFYFLAASTFVCLGVLGFAATLNFKAIIQLSYERAVKPAMRYHEANKWASIAIIGAIFIGTMFHTMGTLLDTYANDADDPVLTELWQVVSVIVLIWVVAALCVCCQLYFLYVVWSYKIKLEAAFYGRPYGSFVVRGEHPSPAKPVLGKISPLMPPVQNDWNRMPNSNMRLIPMFENQA